MKSTSSFQWVVLGLFAVISLCANLVFSDPTPRQKKPPNIIFILADDAVHTFFKTVVWNVIWNNLNFITIDFVVITGLERL